MAKKTPTPTRDQLLHLGSMITYKEEGSDKETCLGDLMYFNGRGTYDPYFGQVDITHEEAELHNKALDEARIKGLDEDCEIGEGCFYYLNRLPKNVYQVASFIGTVISTHVEVHGDTVTFYRNGRTFRGKLRKESDNFNFRRIA